MRKAIMHAALTFAIVLSVVYLTTGDITLFNVAFTLAGSIYGAAFFYKKDNNVS